MKETVTVTALFTGLGFTKGYIYDCVVDIRHDKYVFVVNDVSFHEIKTIFSLKQ